MNRKSKGIGLYVVLFLLLMLMATVAGSEVICITLLAVQPVGLPSSQAETT